MQEDEAGAHCRPELWACVMVRPELSVCVIGRPELRACLKLATSVGHQDAGMLFLLGL